MNGLQNRAIVSAIHPNLVNELKERKRILEEETGRKTKGGITTFSELAAEELRLIRLKGEELVREIYQLKYPPIHKCIVNGVERDVVFYEHFKKIYIFVSVLKKKKDQQQIKVDVQKIKGLKKNEINYYW